MSIEVKNISKLYGEQKALDNVSFNIESGEIIGLLGPNGAGKSTMMKIITCYLPPTEGMVKVCGYDIFDQSLEVRKQVGYLPEHNPLYLDMYVKEYLAFMAGLHKLDEKNKRIRNMIERTGLGPEQHKKIGALSKGYRQRVGLAQAMLHDPKVLILDEPTSGLDPNQLVDIRKLIRDIGREKTVMLSTHIMQEVEAICDRLIIINKGKIVADGNTQEIQHGSQNTDMYEVEFDGEIHFNQLKQIKGIHDVQKVKDNIYHITASNQVDVRGDIFTFAVNKGLKVLSLSKTEHSIEEVFQSLTKGKKK